jgi:hypothetical protein
MIEAWAEAGDPELELDEKEEPTAALACCRSSPQGRSARPGLPPAAPMELQLSCSDSPMMMPSGPRTKQSR